MIGCTALSLCVLHFAFCTPSVVADDSLLPDPEMMRRVEASVDRALEYLLTQQLPTGSWPSQFGDNHGINAVCVLAFLGRGHAPGRGPYAPVLDRGLAHILATQNEQGLYHSPNPSHGPMYEHGLATLAVVEAYGFVGTKAMRASAQRAIDLIVKSQAPVGGWRYQPVPNQADLSVTVMQVVALHAAQNARLDVPRETLDRALGYVRACVVPAGGFAYQPGGGPGRARTAAGVLSMQLLGAFDDPAVENGLAWLHKRGYSRGTGHFFYMNYYAMQAHFQAGDKWWDDWHPKVRDLLFEHQREDGSWPGFGDAKYNGPSLCYSTAMAAIALEVYLHYLPAYQR
jgi:hypothetical protein